MNGMLSKILPFIVMAVFFPALAVMAVKEPFQLLVIWIFIAGFGVIGEFVFTGLGRPLATISLNLLNVLRGRPERQNINWRLQTHGTLWNILVYGLSAAVTFPLVDKVPWFYDLPFFIKGAAFTLGTYLWEYGWGMTIYKLTGVWPWVYKYDIAFLDKFEWAKVVNPLYAPFWFSFGFLLERVHLYVVPNAIEIWRLVQHHQPWQLAR